MSSGKIKIVHLIPSFERAGAETIVTNICNFLPDEVYEIHIVVLENSTPGIVRLDPLRNIQIHVSRGFPFKIKKRLPYFNIKSLVILRAILKSISPDIIHSHLFESFLALNLWLVSIGREYRFVHTAHTNSEHYQRISFRDKFGLIFEKTVIQKLNARFVCVSNDMFKSMKNHYPISQLEVARNSVDTDYYNRECIKPYDFNQLKVPEGSFIILHIGRFAEVKNHPLMFRAMGILIQRKRKVVLVCLGFRGGLFEEYQTLINDYKLDKHIHFLGEVDDPRPYIAASNIGVLPSFHEGLSLALLEMFSMELPVLISSIPSSAEVVDGITDSLFIDVYDPVKLADKIEEVISNRKTYIEIGKKMRTAVVTSFSITQLAKKYDEIYNKLLIN